VIEKAKTLLLVLLVAMSLVQTYFLAYSMPGMEAQVKTRQDYVKTEPLGPEEKVENLLFPEEMVLHLGNDRHTVLYPNDTFYDSILQRLQGREFKGFQSDSVNTVDWDLVRREDIGVEIRFGRAIPFELLQRVFKIDSDFLFSRDSVTRIWIFTRPNGEEVRTFFFSADGVSVYESLRADLTVQDVETYTGFGTYRVPFSSADGQLYVPDKPLSFVALQAGFSRYTPDQMQQNLFFDPGVTRTIQDRQDGTQMYTDGKRGLKVEQDGGWLVYTDPVPASGAGDSLPDNVMTAVQFVNQHGGWNGTHRLVKTADPDSAGVIRFQQFYNRLPIVSTGTFRFGYMQLTLRQGTVSSYERSLLVPGEPKGQRTLRTLPYGDALLKSIRQAAGGEAVEALFPAYVPTLGKDTLKFTPAWAVRLGNGDVITVANG
jgi:regulatory protein YycH of two-component signal transduction system YycFG